MGHHRLERMLEYSWISMSRVPDSVQYFSIDAAVLMGHQRFKSMLEEKVMDKFV